LARKYGNEAVLEYIEELESNASLFTKERLILLTKANALSWKKLRQSTRSEIARHGGSVSKMLRSYQSQKTGKFYATIALILCIERYQPICRPLGDASPILWILLPFTIAVDITILPIIGIWYLGELF